MARSSSGRYQSGCPYRPGTGDAGATTARHGEKTTTPAVRRGLCVKANSWDPSFAVAGELFASTHPASRTSEDIRERECTDVTWRPISRPNHRRKAATQSNQV